MKGGGLDCSKLGDEGYQVEGKGAWMKVAAFKDVWIDKKIREETRVGKELNVLRNTQTNTKKFFYGLDSASIQYYTFSFFLIIANLI